MSPIFPHVLCPPDPSRSLRTGRCELGPVLYLCPTASAGLPAGLKRAWLDQLLRTIQAGAQEAVRVQLRLRGGGIAEGWALCRRPKGYRVGWCPPREPLDEPTALDRLPWVCTREAKPEPTARWARGEDDSFDDGRDIYEDYAELAGMSRDEWMLSVD